MGYLPSVPVPTPRGPNCSCAFSIGHPPPLWFFCVCLFIVHTHTRITSYHVLYHLWFLSLLSSILSFFLFFQYIHTHKETHTHWAHTHTHTQTIMTRCYNNITRCDRSALKLPSLLMRIKSIENREEQKKVLWGGIHSARWYEHHQSIDGVIDV